MMLIHDLFVFDLSPRYCSIIYLLEIRNELLCKRKEKWSGDPYVPSLPLLKRLTDP